MGNASLSHGIALQRFALRVAALLGGCPRLVLNGFLSWDDTKYILDFPFSMHLTQIIPIWVTQAVCRSRQKIYGKNLE